MSKVHSTNHPFILDVQAVVIDRRPWWNTTTRPWCEVQHGQQADLRPRCVRLSLSALASSSSLPTDTYAT